MFRHKILVSCNKSKYLILFLFTRKKLMIATTIDTTLSTAARLMPETVIPHKPNTIPMMHNSKIDTMGAQASAIIALLFATKS